MYINKDSGIAKYVRSRNPRFPQGFPLVQRGFLELACSPIGGVTKVILLRHL